MKIILSSWLEPSSMALPLLKSRLQLSYIHLPSYESQLLGNIFLSDFFLLLYIFFPPVVEELKFAVTDPRWSEKHEAITSLNHKYLSMWNIVVE